MSRGARWLAVGALALAACQSTVASPVIDTWPIGEEYRCAAGDTRCQALIPTAMRGLDEREPGHPPVTGATLHREGFQPDASGRAIIYVRSGDCCSVVVLSLATGELRAIGVGYPGVSEDAIAIHWGP